MWRAVLLEFVFSSLFPLLSSRHGCCVLPLSTTRSPGLHPVRSATLAVTAILIASPSPRHHPDYHSCGLTNWLWLHNPWLWAQKSLTLQNDFIVYSQILPPTCLETTAPNGCACLLSGIITVGQQGSDTVYLVVGLVSGMGGVFFAFAFMALCYRSVVVHKNFSLCLRSVWS